MLCRRTPGHPQGVALLYAKDVGRSVYKPQATRKGWPYYTRNMQNPPYRVGPSLAGGLGCAKHAEPAV